MNLINIKKNDRIIVEFTNESGGLFSGNGFVDRYEDGYVFGRVRSGKEHKNDKPFVCPQKHVLVIGESVYEIHQVWRSLSRAKVELEELKANTSTSFIIKDLKTHLSNHIPKYETWLRENAHIGDLAGLIERCMERVA